MRREPIVFVCVLLVLALMSWSLFQKSAPRAPRNAVRERALELPGLGPEEPVAEFAVSPPWRDVLVEPRVDEPLPPLQLPPPPLPTLAAVLPPPLPETSPAAWSAHLYAEPPQLLGEVDEIVQTEGSGNLSQEFGADPGGTASGGEDAQQDYRATYDWVRVDPLTTFYGHLLGEDRYAKEAGDPLRFQEVNPETGKERFGERTIAGDEYEDFGFAETLRNEIELKVRDWRAEASPGRVAQLREFVHWLLEQGLREPVAFGYAEELARTGVRLAPDELDNWLTLGRVWERTFQLDHAFTLYARLAGEPLPAAAPDLGVDLEAGRFAHASAPRARMGVILARHFGLEARAEEELRAAAAIADGDPLASMELGALLVEQGRAAEAVPLLQRARGMHRSRSAPLALRNGLELGRALLETGAWGEARAAYQDVASAAAAGDDAARADARAGEIAALYLGGRFGEAAESARAGVEEFGAEARLLYLRGITEAALGLDPGVAGGAAGEVVRDLRSAVAASPLDVAPAQTALAFWYDRLGLEQEARQALAAAREQSPQHLYGRYLEAHWAARDGDRARARSGFAAFVSEAPRCAAALVDYGWVLYGDEEHVKAEVALRRAEELRPARAASHGWAQVPLRRGFNLLALGRTEEATAAFERALTRDPDDFAARNGVAVALYQAGDLAGAVAEFSYVADALRDDEDHPQRLYAERWMERVQEHDRLRRWTDDFSGEQIRPGWELQRGARNGVEPRLDADADALVIRGRHAAKGRTSAYRSLQAVAFREFSANFEVGRDHRGDAGVYVATVNRSRETWSFRVYRDREGVVRWRTERGSRIESGEAPVARMAPETPARVRFLLDRETVQPTLNVWVDDQLVYSEEVANLRNQARDMELGFYAETANALPVDASLDDVVIIHRRP